MSDTFGQAQEYLNSPDRRQHPRQPIRSLAYVELDEGNGGIVLNVSEGGLSVQAVTSLMDDFLPAVRFQLSESDSWIQTGARITWAGQSRKVAGLEFVDLPEESRSQIREWLGREALPPEAANESNTRWDAQERSPTAPEAPKSGPPIEIAIEPASMPEPELMLEPAVAEETQGEAPRPDDVHAAQIPGTATPSTISGTVPPVPGDRFAQILARPHEPKFESSVESTASEPINATKLLGGTLAFIAVLVLLAAGSLAAGWAAGQGYFRQALAEIRAIASRNASAVPAAPPPLSIPTARVAEIEVVNASNQRWTIPFDEPISAPKTTVRQPASDSASAQPRKSQGDFRMWILTAPLQPRAAADGTGSQSGGAQAASSTPGDAPTIATTPDSANIQSLPIAPSPYRLPPPAPTGVVKHGELIHRVEPVYPTMASQQNVEGTVSLNVTIGEDGTVRAVTLLRGPLLLVDAAEHAVRQWRYSPTLVDGKSVQLQTRVDLTFHISHDSR